MSKCLRPLPDKGTIGIMAPSSPINENKLEQGVRYLEKLGYRVTVSPGCYKQQHYLAGSPQSRAAYLMDLVHSTTVDAIFFARGGFGSAAMLPLLDFPAIKSSRKLMVGFSDITALQWGIYAQCGLPALSAGMPATDFCRIPVNPTFEKSFWDFIETGRISYNFEWVPDSPSDGLQQQVSAENQPGKPEKHNFEKNFSPFQLRPLYPSGKLDNRKTWNQDITGVALPGTLSVATKLAGTPYEPSFNRVIPILEDVAESRHKIEAYFLQARMAGWFDQAAALLLGDFARPEKETFPENPSLEQLVSRVFGQICLPVLAGLPYGHIDAKIPFPVGQEISLSLGQSITITSTDSLFDF